MRKLRLSSKKFTQFVFITQKKIILLWFIFREREKQHQRDELWSKVESLAARSPAYDFVKAHSNPELNNIATSPEQDDEVSLDNFEQEAQEVSNNRKCFFLTGKL